MTGENWRSKPARKHVWFPSKLVSICGRSMRKMPNQKGLASKPLRSILCRQRPDPTPIQPSPMLWPDADTRDGHGVDTTRTNLKAIGWVNTPRLNLCYWPSQPTICGRVTNTDTDEKTEKTGGPWFKMPAAGLSESSVWLWPKPVTTNNSVWFWPRRVTRRGQQEEWKEDPMEKPAPDWSVWIWPQSPVNANSVWFWPRPITRRGRD